MPHAYSGIHSGRFINAAFEGHTYLEYLQFLATRGVQRQIIASNTRVVFHPENYVITVRLYTTDILGYTPDGMFWANPGGYVTATTTTRMQQFGPKATHFWRRNGHIWCSRGQCGLGLRWPVVPNYAEPVFVPPEPETRIVPHNPLTRRVRSIRLLREL